MAARTQAIWMSVRYLQNSFAPVNRLPPEVICLIPSSFRSKRDLINATAVCRHWRNALLSSPDLWCDVDCSGSLGPRRECMFRECLQRSRSAPLNVRLTSVRYLPDITPHLPRFNSLEIQLTVEGQLAKIATHFSQPAPLLRGLTISAAALGRGLLSLPPASFGGEFAALKTLRLTGFSVLKMPHHFPRLIRFDLQTPDATSLRIDAMLQVLEQMPSLEVLRVRFCPFRHSPVSFASSLRLVSLPKLKEVEITTLDGSGVLQEYPPYIPPLLFALILPSVEQITIGALPPEGSAALPSSFEEQLPSFAETATVEVYSGPGVFSMSFHGRRGSKLLLSTNYNGARPRFEREGFYGTPFFSVKKLVVTVEGIYREVNEDFLELLRTVERLECLEIRGRYARGVLGFWSQLEQRSICPSLRSLVVVRNPNSGSVSGILAKLMIARRSCGVPLAEVVDEVPRF
jgi:hypothetical protein